MNLDTAPQRSSSQDSLPDKAAQTILNEAAARLDLQKHSD